MKTDITDITSIDSKQNPEEQALKKDTSEATAEEEEQAKAKKAKAKKAKAKKAKAKHSALAA